VEPILVTAETMAQYKRDCAADRAAERKANHLEKINQDVKHDRFMFGKTVFVPKELIGYRFKTDELHAIAF
jgi:hypothetical protein